MNEEAKRLIALLKGYGYGRRKFAESVEDQGFASPKQTATMRDMLRRARATHYAKTRRRHRPIDADDGCHHSAENEAMDMGVFI